MREISKISVTYLDGTFRIRGYNLQQANHIIASIDDLDVELIANSAPNAQIEEAIMRHLSRTPKVVGKMDLQGSEYLELKKRLAKAMRIKSFRDLHKRGRDCLIDVNDQGEVTISCAPSDPKGQGFSGTESYTFADSSEGRLAAASKAIEFLLRKTE